MQPTVCCRLAGLSKLEELNINLNLFNSGVPAAVYQLYNLRKLDIWGCGLTEIGDG